jgi:hypothetical protein
MEHASLTSKTPEISTKKPKKVTLQEVQTSPDDHTVPSSKREQNVPTMLRPGLSQKVCVEQIANQIGVKRSQIDSHFYLTGALLTGVERLGKAERIGTWTRKEAAAFLKSAFLPLFELLYEQQELPLVFDLLLARGIPQATIQQPQAAEQVQLSPRQDTLTSATHQEQSSSTKAESYISLLSADAEVGLDGFPGGI